MQGTKRIIAENLSSSYVEYVLIQLPSPIRITYLLAEIDSGSGTFSLELRERSGTVNSSFIPLVYTAQSYILDYPDVDAFPLLNSNKNTLWLAVKKDSGTIDTLSIVIRYNYGESDGILGISEGGTGQDNAIDAVNNLLPAQSGNAGKVLQTDGSNVSWVTPSGGGGGAPLVDGDYGDVVVSGTGTVWTLDSAVVSNTKLVNMAANTLKGNNTGSSASPADLTATQVKSLLSITQSDVSGLVSDLVAKAPLANPTFTGTVILPSTTSIGTVSSTEIGYLDNVTSSIQTQLNSKSATGHTHVVANITDYTTATDSLIDSKIVTHSAAVDPHTGYQLESEKGIANGYPGLNVSGYVPTGQLASGTATSSTFLRGDNTWAVPPGTGGGSGTGNAYFPGGWG